MDSTLRVLAEKLEEERNRIIDSISGGAAKDYADYQHSVGKILGLMTALREITDLAKNMEDNDD